MKKNLILLLLIPCFISLSSCEKEKTKKAPDTKIFKVELFKASLESQLNSAMGYAFVINKDGQWVDSTSSGVGYQNASNGVTGPASVLFDINIASVTKTITAMAAIKLLEEKGLSVEGTIGNWLPGYWNASGPMSNITFRQLLTHTSGIRQSNTSWDSLQATISGQLEGAQSYSYSNANFALFRALLPKINDQAGFDALEANSPSFETWMSNKYIDIVQTQVFDPAGIFNASCNVSPGVTTMQAFNEIGTPLVAQNAGDWTELCGGGGFYLSTIEMARLMAYVAHSNFILTQSQKTLMDGSLFGWDPGDSFTTTRGQVYGKDGALFWDNDGDTQVSGGDSGLQTWVGKFPNGVELSLSVTSIPSNFRNLATIVKVAYELAWVDE